jgi:hypothetical protein
MMTICHREIMHILVHAIFGISVFMIVGCLVWTLIEMIRNYNSKNDKNRGR